MTQHAQALHHLPWIPRWRCCSSRSTSSLPTSSSTLPCHRLRQRLLLQLLLLLATMSFAGTATTTTTIASTITTTTVMSTSSTQFLPNASAQQELQQQVQQQHREQSTGNSKNCQTSSPSTSRSSNSDNGSSFVGSSENRGAEDGNSVPCQRTTTHVNTTAYNNTSTYNNLTTYNKSTIFNNTEINNKTRTYERTRIIFHNNTRNDNIITHNNITTHNNTTTCNETTTDNETSTNNTKQNINTRAYNNTQTYNNMPLNRNNNTININNTINNNATPFKTSGPINFNSNNNVNKHNNNNNSNNINNNNSKNNNNSTDNQTIVSNTNETRKVSSKSNANVNVKTKRTLNFKSKSKPKSLAKLKSSSGKNWKFNRTKVKRSSLSASSSSLSSSSFSSSTSSSTPFSSSSTTPSPSSSSASSSPTIPTTTRSLTSPSPLAMWSQLSLWQHQQHHPFPSAPHNLKVNQVFESERHMSHGQVQRNRGKIVLLGLFELSTKHGPRPDGLTELGAAMMAVEHINRKQLLPGYTLELVTNDTQCDPGVGVDRFFHAIYTQPSTRMVMLLGSACSEVTESLAKVVPYWNIVQVSFGSTSPALSDRQEFPYFYRTVAPDSSHNPARIAFIRRFGWDTVTTFSQNEEVHSLAVNDLVTELEAANISCAATITFAETDLKEQLLLLRETDTRIIIGSFSQDLAPKILCEAYKLRMFGADYAWILHESMGAPWWNELPARGTHHCSGQELQEAVENLIIVSSHNSIVGNNVSLSGLSNEMFNTQLRKQFAHFDQSTVAMAKTANARRRGASRTGASNNNKDGTIEYNNNNGMSRYAPQTYDAVWAIALALRAAEDHWRKDAIQSKLDRFDYTRSDMAWEFLQQMGKLDFLGVSGPVSFSGPDRIGTTAFYQIQSGILEPVALFYPAENELDFNCPRCRQVRWHGGQVPIAKRVFKVRVATIAPLAFYTIATLSSVGIALAIAFLAFNLHFRKLKAIKLSSPKLSNITAVGCIFVYAAVILLGLDYSTLPSAEDSFATVCTARVYLLSAGFSLAFGSMFAKTYRVHRIFTRTGSVFKDKMLQDIQLILLVCALLLLDGLVVTLWVVADPMERHLNNLTLEISSIDRSVVYQPQVEVCRSQHTQTWLGALYAYKGLLLVVGVYMAWETRHVKIAALNDSQYIGVSVYSVVITSGIVVVLANLISERVTLAFITITALILTSTTATLCLLFIPKLHDIWARNDIIDPVIHSMGLKMECNTRRFVLDDRRELQYRVEVQNRVYKKEIAALDAEIRKLERMLESGTASTTTSSSTSLLFGQQKPELTITSDTSIHLPPPPPFRSGGKSRTPSISGILPNLLLSVLPPVIPRASWPSAEYMQVPMRRSVTFASQPQLDPDRSIADACLPAQDLFNLRLAHQQATEAKTGLIERLRGIFSRTASSNKGSMNSLAGAGQGAEQKGLRAAFKSHMGLFTRLIPSSQTASCNAIFNAPGSSSGDPAAAAGAPGVPCGGGGVSSGSANLKPMHRLSFAKSGTHLDVTLVDPTFLPIPTIATISAEVEACDDGVADLGGKYIRAHETRVNFALPLSRRPSNVAAAMQPTLRERVRGSPRFPHRILPANCGSLGALEESDDQRGATPSRLGRKSLQQASSTGNWKSMEVTAKSRLSLNGASQEDLQKEPGGGEEKPPDGEKDGKEGMEGKEEKEEDEKVDEKIDKKENEKKIESNGKEEQQKAQVNSEETEDEKESILEEAPEAT